MENSKQFAKVTVNGVTFNAPIGAKLSSVLKTDMPCGGHGKCGKCKVKAYGKLSTPLRAEIEYLTTEELKSSVRLACMTVIEGDCAVETFSISENKILTSGCMADFTLNPLFSKHGVAIDIGTTTIAAKLYNINGEILAQYSALNPQSVYGADVISRIEAALSGKNKELASVISSALNETILKLIETASIKVSDIDAVAITGNTAMLHFLTDTDVEPLSHAPFSAKELFGKNSEASEIGLSVLNSNTKIYIPNCISAFVGADIVCAIIATGMCNTENTELLADIGTNGEIALIKNGNLTVSSTAAGPAFEGVGISMGMRSEIGAIDRAFLEDGKIKTHIIGEASPKGICGSGLIDAVSCLLKTEQLDQTGYLEDDIAYISDAVSLSAKDIRMVQLAKSAICAGINTLLKENGILNDDISVMHIAGGFGSYLNLYNAGEIGLIPKPLVEKAKVGGNAALSGASMLLLNRDLHETAKNLSTKAKVLDLSTNKIFAEEYMEQMMF